MFVELCPNYNSMLEKKSDFIEFQEAYMYVYSVYRVPTRTGKPGKMGRHFPVREKSGNFEQTGKVRENHTKY